MPYEPPPFASPDYWDTRFTKNPSTFEWLLPASAIDAPLTDAILKSSNPAPKILHIGCGTSLLSYRLRAHVENPEQIHNVDFSEKAIELGQQREKDIFDNAEDAPEEADGTTEQNEAREEQVGDASGMTREVEKPNEQSTLTSHTANSSARASEAPESPDGDVALTGQLSLPAEPQNSGMETELMARLHALSTEPKAAQTSPPHMQWSTINLLSHASVLSACAPQAYDIVVEKSCSDSIACGEDVSIPHLCPLYTAAKADEEKPQDAKEEAPHRSVHPLYILALHLALLVRPGGRWIALSYSETRFPFFPNPFAPPEEYPAGVPHPARFWRLERREPIEVAAEESTAGMREVKGGDGAAPVHRPPVMHWLYELVRTEEELLVK